MPASSECATPGVYSNFYSNYGPAYPGRPYAHHGSPGPAAPGDPAAASSSAYGANYGSSYGGAGYGGADYGGAGYGPGYSGYAGGYPGGPGGYLPGGSAYPLEQVPARAASITLAFSVIPLRKRLIIPWKPILNESRTYRTLGMSAKPRQPC